MLQGVVQQWLGKYQDTAVQYAQQGYDQIQDYVRSNFNDYVEANNLTQVVQRLTLSLQPLPKPNHSTCGFLCLPSTLSACACIAC